MSRLLLVLSTLFLLSCDPSAVNELARKLNIPLYDFSKNSASVNITEEIIPLPNELIEGSYDDDSRQEKRRDSSGCGHTDGIEDGPEVSLSNPSNVGSRNAGKYKLYGRCSEHKIPVEIKVNEYPISHAPICNRGRWEVFLNLTQLSADESEISFKVSQGRDSNVVCEKVRVAFSCPTNYIPVSPIKENRNYSDNSFCVMKYEARVEDGKAISTHRGRPVTRLLFQEATDLCRSNGPRYDLINNEQWQVLAQNIEFEGKNWSKGSSRVIYGNTLNCGVNVGPTKTASSNDKDSCNGASGCDSKWDYKRRTHFLSNGYYIWDVCGNAGEMVKEAGYKSRRRSYKEFNDHIYLARPSNIKRDFGPRRNYESSIQNARKHAYWGLGYAKVKNGENLVIRGQQGRYAGVFSTLFTEKREEFSSSKTGFRCIYNP